MGSLRRSYCISFVWAVAADCGGQGAYVDAPSLGFRGSLCTICHYIFIVKGVILPLLVKKVILPFLTTIIFDWGPGGGGTFA